MKNGTRLALPSPLVLALATALFLSAAACATTAPLPAKALALNAAGAEALAQGDLSTAEARLSVALEYSPRFVEAWVNLGYVELRRGNFAQARRDFVRARELNQDIPAPHHALGLLADRQGRGDEAEESYRDALRVDPGFGPARANLARRLFARGQYENAREQFQRLREVAPDATEGWVGEAESLLELRRETEAEGVVARARERLGDLPPLMLLVARARIGAGAWDEAEAVLAKLVGDPDRGRAAAAWAWLAVSRVGRGDAGGATDAARAALAIDGDDPVARYALALVAVSGGTGTPSRRAPE
ncbi:MAG TPA: tetratricopeptide repeat protein [Polyangiaceae bacterium]